MKRASLHVALPALPDPGIFSNADHSILSDDGTALLSYDPATRAAFIYVIALRRWTIQSPVDFDTFVLTASMAGYRLADTAEARRWLTCGERSCRPVPSAARH